jgi:hypothetical protein
MENEMADNKPAAPPADPSSMTPEVAGATLAQMQADAHPPAPLAPTTAAEANARLQALTSNKEWVNACSPAAWKSGGNFSGSPSSQPGPTK